MHQKTPVFLVKYFHNKDLNEIKPQISQISQNLFLTRINTVFSRLGVLDKPCFLSKLNRRICPRPLVGQRQAAHFLSRAKNTDFRQTERRTSLCFY